MSPLDAARRLLEANESGLLPSDADGNCWYCFWHLLHDGSGHDPDCPWPALPRIIAALEAAERIARIDPAVNLWSHSGQDYWCYACDAHLLAWEAKAEEPHKSDCPQQALVAALKGEARADGGSPGPIDDHLAAIFSEAAGRLARGESAGVVPSHPLFQRFMSLRGEDSRA